MESHIQYSQLFFFYVLIPYLKYLNQQDDAQGNKGKNLQMHELKVSDGRCQMVTHP